MDDSDRDDVWNQETSADEDKGRKPCRHSRLVTCSRDNEREPGWSISQFRNYSRGVNEIWYSCTVGMFWKIVYMSDNG